MNSLIRYLDPVGHTFHLNLSELSHDRSSFQESGFPFSVIGDSDPLARLIPARLVSDAGSEIKKLFCFVQRDAYPLKNNTLWPFTNLDVGKAWQKSFAFYADTKRGDRSFVLLSHQLGEKGELESFASLFYCKTKKAFFTPPCPACGQVLQQCEDDSLLTALGLPPFSTSLKRYLYCPSCKAPEFYADERALGDPSCVLDRQSLMTGLGELKKTAEATAFPCADCSLHEECYATGRHVRERMVPFSFYPFYMLAFEAPSLNATDFIALISGAAFQEIQQQAEAQREFGRAAALKTLSDVCAGSRPVLFDYDDRHFLEVLYLKLAFLEEVIRNFQSGGPFAHPDMNPGLDQIWVTFPEGSGLLPRFWNFKAGFLGIGKEQINPLMPGVMSDSGMLLGMIWFYTLLTNKKQGMADLLECLKKYAPDGAASFEKLAKEKSFDAANIFWDPQGQSVNAAWTDLWDKALKMGWSLATSGLQDAGNSREPFLEQLAGLTQDIKENLFIKEIPWAVAASAPASGVVETEPPKTKDEAIHDILLGLVSKLQSAKPLMAEPQTLKVSEAPIPAAAEKTDQEPGRPVEEDIDEPVTETVIFSSRPAAKAGAMPSVQETQIIAQDRPSREVPMEDQETLILSVKDLEAQAKPKAREADKMEETVILSVQPPVKEAPAAPPERKQQVSAAMPSQEVSIENQETVILSVGDLEKQKKPEPPKTASVLEETVIMSAIPPAAKEVKSPPAAAAQWTTSSKDLLEETVILRPGEKSKDGAKK